MHPTSRTFLAGHTGRIGRALLKHLAQHGHRAIVTRAQARLDLTDPRAVDAFFAAERPEYVFFTAAAWASPDARDVESAQPARTLHDDLLMQTHVIAAAHRHGVKRLLFVVPSSVYPAGLPGPIAESALLGGPMSPAERPTAVARIAGIELLWNFNRQHGTRFLAAALADTYGPDDSYDPVSARVVPAMVRAFHAARQAGDAQVVLAGTGAAEIDLLFNADAAAGLAHLMRLPDAEFDALLAGDDPATGAPRAPLVNLGSGESVSIAALARQVRSVVGFGGTLAFDAQQADVPWGRRLDTRLAAGLGWRATTGLADGLARAYADFRQRDRVGTL